MLFIHTIDKVLSGEKTQTRRLAKDDEGMIFGRVGSICQDIEEYINSYPRMGVSYIERVRFQIGKTYAAQPGRGKPQQGRIKITAIRCEHLLEITDADAIKEGFASRDEFLAAWDKINGPNARNKLVWVLDFEVVK